MLTTNLNQQIEQENAFTMLIIIKIKRLTVWETLKTFNDVFDNSEKSPTALYRFVFESSSTEMDL